MQSNLSVKLYWQVFVSPGHSSTSGFTKAMESKQTEPDVSIVSQAAHCLSDCLLEIAKPHSRRSRSSLQELRIDQTCYHDSLEDNSFLPRVQ